MKIVGASLGVEAGATFTKAVMIAVANQIIIRLSASTAVKVVPFLGGFVGGSANYAFIKLIGASVKAIDMQRFSISG